MQKTNKQKTRQLKPTQIYFRNAAANQNMRRRFKTGNTVRQQIAGGGGNRKTKNIRKHDSQSERPKMPQQPPKTYKTRRQKFRNATATNNNS